MKNKAIKYFSALLVVILLFGCTSGSVFDKGDFKITLPDGFKEYNIDGYTYYFEMEEVVAITALKETRDELKDLGLDQNSTVRDYMSLVLSTNGKDSSYIVEKNFVYYTYSETIEGDEFYYNTYAFASKDAFWLVNMMCYKKDQSKYEKEFFKWAESIEV